MKVGLYIKNNENEYSLSKAVRVVDSFLFCNKVKEIDVNSLLYECKRDLEIYDLEDKELIFYLFSVLIKEDYDRALLILSKCNVKTFPDLEPTLFHLKESDFIEFSLKETLVTGKIDNRFCKKADYCKQKNSVVNTKPVQNAKKNYKNYKKRKT